MSYSRPAASRVAEDGDFMSPSEIVKLVASEPQRPARQGSTWVSVAKRVPDQSGDYLVLLRGDRHKLMSFEKNENTFTPRSMSQVVTHWMALPPAPE